MWLSEDQREAKFEVPGTFHGLINGRGWESGTLYISLDISGQRRVLEALFNSESLEFGDALALTFLAFAGMTHPVIHSYANWGVSTTSKHPFLRKMALCTLKYKQLWCQPIRERLTSSKMKV